MDKRSFAEVVSGSGNDEVVPGSSNDDVVSGSVSDEVVTGSGIKFFFAASIIIFGFYRNCLRQSPNHVQSYISFSVIRLRARVVEKVNDLLTPFIFFCDLRPKKINLK